MSHPRSHYEHNNIDLTLWYPPSSSSSHGLLPSKRDKLQQEIKQPPKYIYFDTTIIVSLLMKYVVSH